MMSGVRDFAIAAVISRDGFSPFYLGVRRSATNTRSHAFFPGDFFARHRLAAAASGSDAGGGATVQSANSGPENR